MHENPLSQNVSLSFHFKFKGVMVASWLWRTPRKTPRAQGNSGKDGGERHAQPRTQGDGGWR